MTTWAPKVGRHVNYAKALPARAGVTNNKRWVQATITLVTNPTTLNLRIGHSGEVVVGALKQTAENQVGVWKPL